jgi:hypothetical protein
VTTPRRNLTGTTWETGPGERWYVVGDYGDRIEVQRIGTETRYTWPPDQLERFKAKEIAE